MKTQRSGWILPALLMLAAVAVIALSGVRISAAEPAPMSVAQVQIKQRTDPVGPGRGAPGSIKSNKAEVKVLCNGKTKTACCENISYCACLYPPMPKKGEKDKPLSCHSSPPKD